MDQPDIFEPYERLIEIEILGRKYSVPENNSILRCLQFLEMEDISEGDFCWNGECLNCQVWIKNGEKEKAVMSCRTNAVVQMQIVRINKEIPFNNSEPPVN
ncbi:MAG TPA: 2Fe-2S iron-sulfur cluster-binding protein [Pyrinomonadaceae bacterium]|nr:2Fe-2S iron-sulfur cluster-binding protein [Pyrinomonadaceae bacterium]